MQKPMRKLVFLIGLGAASSLVGGCTIADQDYFYVENAQLSDLDAHHDLKERYREDKFGLPDKKFIVTGHRLEAGKGLILAVREFSRRALSVDTASFQKITIQIEGGFDTDTVTLPSNGIVAFLSSGGSAFPGVSGCYGYAKDGEISLTRLDEGQLQAKMHLIFEQLCSLGREEDSGPYKLDLEIILERKTIDQLTPWEGATGEHIYDESMRD